MLGTRLSNGRYSRRLHYSNIIMRYVDLTHTFTQHMPTYPGDPKPELTQIAFIDQHGYNDFQIKTGMHVGTHLDAPWHLLQNGQHLSAYPPQHFFGPGRLIDARGEKTIEAKLLRHKQIAKGDIVLVMTGYYKKFSNPDYYENYPEISSGFAAKIVELGVKIIGLDTPSPDRPPFAIHKLLLSNDILIIENLTNLEALLEPTQFNVVALPAKFEAEAAPVRVVAQIP